MCFWISAHIQSLYVLRSFGTNVLIHKPYERASKTIPDMPASNFPQSDNSCYEVASYSLDSFLCNGTLRVDDTAVFISSAVVNSLLKCSSLN